MADRSTEFAPAHPHVFLGEGHASSERRTWAVIGLCGAMMIGEIVGGLMFGSIALVADGMHMSTHAGALLLAALAYTYARRHVADPRFTFGTGKIGDLAGFASAIALAMIAALVAYESMARLFTPTPIHFAQAIPIACLGLAVNLASAWLLGGGRDHHHAHGHAHDHAHGDVDGQPHRIATADGIVALEVFETGVPPRFRLRAQGGPALSAGAASVETERPDGARQLFAMRDQGLYLESVEEIPEPHAFTAHVKLGQKTYPAVFSEPAPVEGRAARDNNMRAAVIHVIADAAVSVMVIAGLSLALLFGWLWLDPLAGVVGALVIASWSFALIRDTGAILLDMNPDPRTAARIRAIVEEGGDRLADLHLWRLGPGHFGAIVCVATGQGRGADYYRARLAPVSGLSHLTIEVASG